MRDSAITGKGAMKKKHGQLRTRDPETINGDAKQAHEEAKTREKDAVARAVLEALSAHDSM